MTTAEALAAEMGGPIPGHDHRLTARAQHQRVLHGGPPTRPTLLQENPSRSPSVTVYAWRRTFSANTPNAAAFGSPAKSAWRSTDKRPGGLQNGIDKRCDKV